MKTLLNQRGENVLKITPNSVWTRMLNLSVTAFSTIKGATKQGFSRIELYHLCLIIMPLYTFDLSTRMLLI